MDAPKGSVEYPFAIATRAKWSKNVVSFANCPDQFCLDQNVGRTVCNSTLLRTLKDGSIATLMI
jgi:hypothetical protein